MEIALSQYDKLKPNKNDKSMPQIMPPDSGESYYQDMQKAQLEKQVIFFLGTIKKGATRMTVTTELPQ